MTSQEPKIYNVLLVEDNDLFRVRLRRVFEMADEFEFAVFEASSVTAYHEQIKKHHADIMVVDISLQANLDEAEGIDDVLQFHQLHSPDTIVIICSAFPNMDPLKTCVKAMRAGAVDCIAKGDNSFKEVVERAVEELRVRNSGIGGPSSAWLERELPALVQQFGGKAIAIHEGRVVDHADSIPLLRKQLATGNIPKSAYLMSVPNWGNE